MIKYLRKKFRRISAWMAFEPLHALSSKGWRLFKKEFKQKAPIRHWIKYIFTRKYIWPIKRVYKDILYWILYRTTYRYHILKTGLEPGYYDIDTLMLHVNFNILKDFVEVEQAHHIYVFSDEYLDRSWFEKHMPFYNFFYPFRRPDLGIKHFEWCVTLDDPSLPLNQQSPQQAEYGREVIILYKWWVNRPNRKKFDVPDYDDQGLGIMAVLDDDFDRNSEDYKKHSEIMAKNVELEGQWNEEDQQMLIRLIKIRSSLWT